MSYGVAPFAVDGRSTAVAAGAVKNDPYWDGVVFLSHCDRSFLTSSLIDEKGHTVSHAAGSVVNSSATAVGNGYLSNTGGACTVSASGSEFYGFRLSDAWTLETRFFYNLTFYIYSGDPAESPLGVRLFNNSDNTACLYIAGQGSSAGYRTENFDWSVTTTYRSLVIESDGTTLRVSLNRSELALTPVAEYYSLNPWSGRIVLSYGAYDEIRFTKAARYAGSVPAYPWPFYDGKEAWSGKALSAGVATVSAVARETDAHLDAVASAGGSAECSAIGDLRKARYPAIFLVDAGSSAAAKSGEFSDVTIAERAVIAVSVSEAIAVGQRLVYRPTAAVSSAGSVASATGQSLSCVASGEGSIRAGSVALFAGRKVALLRYDEMAGSTSRSKANRILTCSARVDAMSSCRGVSPVMTAARDGAPGIFVRGSAHRWQTVTRQKVLHVAG